MTRILLVLAAVMGMNAAEVPQMIGDQLSSIGGPAGHVAREASSALTHLAGNVSATGMSSAKVSQASVMRVSGINMVKTQPINVAKTSVASRRGQGFGGLSF